LKEAAHHLFYQLSFCLSRLSNVSWCENAKR